MLLVLDTSAAMGAAVDGTTVPASASCSGFFTTPTYSQYCHSGDTSGRSPDGAVAPAIYPQTSTQYGTTNTTSVADWTGGLSWIRQGSGSCKNGNCTVWKYALQFMPPSRLALVKNTLGNSVSVMTSYSAPTSWPSYASTWSAGTVSPSSTLSASSAVNSSTWLFTVTFGSQTSDPGDPFSGSTTTTTYDSSNRPSNSTFGTGAVQGPQDLVGSTTSSINWGLIVYPTTTTALGATDCSTGNASFAVPLDTSDASSSVSSAAIEALLSLSSVSTCIDRTNGKDSTGNACSGNPSSSRTGSYWYGLGAADPAGSANVTSTKSALEYAKNALTTLHDGGSVTLTPANNLTVGAGECSAWPAHTFFGASSCTAPTSYTFSADTKATTSCTRNYGMLLATAGTSQTCNVTTTGQAWSSCTTDAVPSTDYPPAVASEVANLSLTPKVWVLGPSSGAAAQTLCELNKTAFAGNTDKSSPNGDWGWTVSSDPSRLGSSNYVADYGYAFYADDFSSTLLTAFSNLYVPGSGDYPTSVPVALADSITALHNTGGSSTLVLLSSSSYPSWKGHLRLIDYQATAIQSGSGSPEGVLTANPGTIYQDSTTSHYWQKATGTGNTGWVDLGTSVPANATADNQILWDAGNNLVSPYLDSGLTTPNPAYVAPNSRKIYTWNSSFTPPKLVPVTKTNVQTIVQLYGWSAGQASTYITDQFIDFVKGADGTVNNIPRCWSLGPITNSTPAVIADPPTFSNFAGTAEDHANFYNNYVTGATVTGGVASYTGRAPMIWVGSDDGMFHAFALLESSPGAGDAGREVLALIPPNMFSTIYDLYYNYAANSTGNCASDLYQTGQPSGSIDNHVYGAAQSVRFADIYDPNGSKDAGTNYRTIAYLTEGPGGDLIAAVDVTHPYYKDSSNKDPNFGTFPSSANCDNTDFPNGCPVAVLWSKTGTTGNPVVLSGLYKSWSVPAVGAASSDGSTWYAVFGSGQDTTSTNSTNTTSGCSTNSSPCENTSPSVFTVDALTGSVINSTTPKKTSASPGSTFVGEQFTGNSVLFQRKRNGQKFDDIVDSALQGDLLGRVYPLTGVSFTDNQPSQIISAWKTNGTFIPVNQHVAPDYSVVPKVLGDLNITTPTLSSDQAQPLYFPLTTSGLGGDNACNLFAFGSGSIYERSSNVTGSNVGTGTGTYFIPSLFTAQRSKTSTSAICTSTGSTCQMTRTAIGSIHRAILDNNKNDVGQACTASTPEGCLGSGTQLSGPGIIAVPLSSTSTNGTAIGLFLVFDPSNTYTTCASVSVNSSTGARTCNSPSTTTTCSGSTYVIFQEVKPTVNADGTCSTTSSPTISSTNAYYVGAGVSSGMAIGQGNQLVFAKSGTGSNSATVVQGASLPPVNPGGSGNVSPTWWMELK